MERMVEDDDELALYIGRRVLADTERLRLFMPDCFARIPLWVDGKHYDLIIVLKRDEDERVL